MSLTFTGYLPSSSSAIATETARAMAAEALLAPLASPNLSGNPTAPTPSPGDNDTSIATTAFAVTLSGAGVAAEVARATGAESLLAPKASPTFTGTVTIPGTITNDNAAAGKLGEFISSTVLAGALVSLTTATTANVTSISLTAGDWDVWGNICFAANAATTATVFAGGISLTSATYPTAPGSGAMAAITNSLAPAIPGVVMPVGQLRVSIASTTTVYLLASAIFAVNTMGVFGFIGARRAR